MQKKQQQKQQNIAKKCMIKFSCIKSAWILFFGAWSMIVCYILEIILFFFYILF